MLRNDAVDSDEQSLVSSSANQKWEVEIPDAPTVRLQTLDLARHVAITPDKRRYVVATYNDTHISGSYITAVYPQQNGYLTLVRLMVHAFKSETPEQAIQLHRALIQAIQQDTLDKFIKARSK
jgi:ABC-type transport system involved in Fe-S cluster assembly fused permease/ATPase subunit